MKEYAAEIYCGLVPFFTYIGDDAMDMVSFHSWMVLQLLRT
jgi:hypothetical protein